MMYILKVKRANLLRWPYQGWVFEGLDDLPLEQDDQSPKSPPSALPYWLLIPGSADILPSLTIESQRSYQHTMVARSYLLQVRHWYLPTRVS